MRQHLRRDVRQYLCGRHMPRHVRGDLPHLRLVRRLSAGDVSDLLSLLLSGRKTICREPAAKWTARGGSLVKEEREEMRKQLNVKRLTIRDLDESILDHIAGAVDLMPASYGYSCGTACEKPCGQGLTPVEGLGGAGPAQRLKQFEE